jgi:hypothetical protein
MLSEAGASESIKSHFGRIYDGSYGIINHVVTMDETWVHKYDPQTREHTKAWTYSGYTCPEKLKTKQISNRTLASVF